MAEAADGGELSAARAALSDHIPDVAIQKLERVLGSPDLTDEERQAATLLMAEAESDLGRTDEALALLLPSRGQNDRAVVFLEARIYARAGRWTDALNAFQQSILRGDPLAHAGAAECLDALGRSSEAAEELESAIDSGLRPAAVQLRLASILVDLGQVEKAVQILRRTVPSTALEANWMSFVRGRVFLAQDQPYPAMSLFEELLGSKEHPTAGMSDSLYFGSAFGLAQAQAALNGSAVAHRVMEDFIWTHPESRYLELAFQRLDEMYSVEESPSESVLHEWRKDEQYPRRAALALFYVARMQLRSLKYEKAEQSLETFVAAQKDHPLLAQAYLMQAEVFVHNDQIPNAIRVLDAALRLTHDDKLRAAIELQAGLDHYQQNEDVLAAQLFESAARHSPKLRQIATFDAALGWLSQRNYELFHEEEAALAKLDPNERLRGDLVLEEGLMRARSGDPRAAEDKLKQFLRSFPKHPRTAEANLALAEISFTTHNADGIAKAEEYLQVVDRVTEPADIAEHSEYLAIFMEASRKPANPDAVIALCLKFLKSHPSSPLAIEVRMKLGQIYFQKDDFPDAEKEFITVATTYDASSYTDAALFLAGQSAAKLMEEGAADRAIAHFEKVAQRNGPLRLYAREEQAAILQSRSGHESEALKLYDIILHSDPPPDLELKEATLCASGDCLRLMGKDNPEHLQEAVAAFDALAALPEASSYWRSQALYKKANTLELLGRKEQAIEIYYDVLNGDSAARIWQLHHRTGYYPRQRR